MDTRTILRLRTALDLCDELARFVTPSTQVEIMSDPLRRAAIERQVELVGFALGSVLDHEPELASRLPGATSMAALAGQILREYDTVRVDDVWHAASTLIPVLADQLRELHDDLDGTLPTPTALRQLPQVIIDQHDSLIAICIQYRIHRLSVFGSAVHDTFDPETSDLDFVVDIGEHEPGVSRRFIDFADALEHLYGRSVDLVTLHERTRPWFRDELERTAVVVYDRQRLQPVER